MKVVLLKLLCLGAADSTLESTTWIPMNYDRPKTMTFYKGTIAKFRFSKAFCAALKKRLDKNLEWTHGMAREKELDPLIQVLSRFLPPTIPGGL